MEMVPTNSGSWHGTEVVGARKSHLREGESFPDSDCKTTLISYRTDDENWTTAKGVADWSSESIDRTRIKDGAWETIEVDKEKTWC